MGYRYFLCDVFTSERFGGNQLAVVPNAQGLTSRQMQQIAREFNFSETTFVLPPEKGQTRQVRIFTPTTEVPFAGHPNIGTAFVLASMGELEGFEQSGRIVFEEKAGLVPITLGKLGDGGFWAEVEAPEKLSLGTIVPVSQVAAALALSAEEIVTETHVPQVASVGLPFLMVELLDRAALERAKVRLDGFEEIATLGIVPDIHVYVHSDDGFDIRARVFAPLDGVPEDPATGSANCALAGLLARCDDRASGAFEWRIAQGVEMGRPSVLEARAEKKDGKIVSTWIAGSAVKFSEGVLELD